MKWFLIWIIAPSNIYRCVGFFFRLCKRKADDDDYHLHHFGGGQNYCMANSLSAFQDYAQNVTQMSPDSVYSTNATTTYARDIVTQINLPQIFLGLPFS